MRKLGIPLPCYAPDGGGSGGAPAASAPVASPSTPSGGGGSPAASSVPASPEPSASPAASTPAPATPAPSRQTDQIPVDFSQLGEPEDDTPLPTDNELAAAVEPAPQTPPAAPPAPAQPAETAPTPQQPTPQEPASPAPVEPVNLVKQLTEHRQAIVDGLAAERFALTKEEAEGLDANPGAVIPKLMARVHFEAVNAALLHIQNYVPMIAAHVMTQLTGAKEAEQAFYSQNTALDRAKHGQDVIAFNRAFRASNPQMPAKDLMAMVAAAVMAKHGLTGQPAPSPTTPQTPRPAPFIPAAPGGGAARVTVEANPFEGLGMDFDE